MRLVSASTSTRTRAWRAAIVGIVASAGFFSMGLQPAIAGTETLIYQFNFTPDATEPDFGLAKGPDGNFYGVTRLGGAQGGGVGNGAIYQLKPPASGKSTWKESIIWSFKGGTKGKWPSGPLVFGPNGTAYGLTNSGGDLTDCNNQGCGTAYSITIPAPGKKLGVFKIIHNFHHVVGSSPNGAMVFDSAGNLYGATLYGGNDNYCSGDKGGCGVIFKLTPPAAGKVAWEQTTLHQMQHQFGAVPNGGLIFDPTETTLYGTAEGGGAPDLLNGVVFSLTKPGLGLGYWTYSMLHHFGGNAVGDGNIPYAGLVSDNAGNLYGTTQYGGDALCGNSFGCGVAFKMTKSGNVWNETIVHTFKDGTDGRYPLSALVYDGANLYGTTEYGGGGDVSCGNGCGTVYKIALTPTPGYSVLHAFQNIQTDGIVPTYARLLLDNGTLYGTTSAGGKPFYGTAFSLTLP